ncbi:MAG TPA: NUDIX hydrolase [Woeseiaceae bacterium]|nr:NUDIX hydrolase [Woeseiaceae bacterium]
MKFCSNCGGPVGRRVPHGDNRPRWVCDRCATIHYQNPKIVVGCVPERDGRILLCKRGIEPRRGYWTVPAGFMELGETLAEGAMRETREEACAEVELGHLFAWVDVLEAGQVHLFFTARLLDGYAAGAETEEADLFAIDDIPWADIAFRSVRFALEKYLEDAGTDNGLHFRRIPHGE